MWKLTGSPCRRQADPPPIRSIQDRISLLSKTPISDRLDWKDARPPWDGVSSPLGDMPTNAFRQAILVFRYDVTFFAAEFSRRTRLSMNAAYIAVELHSEAVTLGRWHNYSRSDDFYKREEIRKSKLMTKRRVCGGVEELSKAGFIDDWRQEAFNFGEQSAMRARPGLVHLVQAIIDDGHRPYPHRPERLLILRDAAGETMKLKDTAQVRRETRELNMLNYGICQSTISLTCGVPLTRIYNLDPTLRRGGRCYAEGMLYQGWSRERRAEIMIDGAPNAEWDYGSIHGFMLYCDRGLTPPSDAYDLDFWNRDLQKAAFVILINAKDYDQAIYSLARKKTMSAHAVPGSDDAMFAARQLIGEMRIRHRAIQDAFCSDAGAYLQKREADIIVEVMLAMRKRGETTLPVHDSIMCRSWASDWLVEEMRKAADRAGLHGIRIEKVEPKRPADEDAVEGDFPIGSMGVVENVMSYSFMSSPTSIQPDSTVVQSFQDDSTIQVGFLVNPTETAVEVLSLAKLVDHCTKTSEAAPVAQDETPPPSHAHTLDPADSGTTAMFKLDQKTIPTLTPTPIMKLQDDAGRDSLPAVSDAHPEPTTPIQSQGLALTSMWNQTPSTMKPVKVAATRTDPGSNPTSMWNLNLGTVSVNAAGDADPISTCIDASVSEESILDGSSDLEDGSNLNRVAEESIQVPEIESGTVGNLNQVPVSTTVETIDPLMVAEIDSGSQESIQVASSTVVDGSNLNQVPGIESGHSDLLLRTGDDQPQGSRNLNHVPETSHDDAGGPNAVVVNLTPSVAVELILNRLETATVEAIAPSPVSDRDAEFRRRGPPPIPSFVTRTSPLSFEPVRKRKLSDLSR